MVVGVGIVDLMIHSSCSLKAKRQVVKSILGRVRSKFDLSIAGQVYDLYALLEVLGLAFEDIKPIDAHVMGENLYAVRYFDPEDRNIVAYEFDGAFRHVRETIVHIAEWMGDAYFEFNWGAWCPWSF